MSDNESPASAILGALGFAVFVRERSGALRVCGEPPEWLSSLWPDTSIEKASPFLENFLTDAAACWVTGVEERARSGPWVEQTSSGDEVTLEATALTASGHSILLIERLGEVFEAKKLVLQKARETSIAYQHLESEMQKKEILLSCVAEEMRSALANVITSLRLMELESNPVKTGQLLSLASRAAEEQEGLIKKVLDVFAAEVEMLYGQDGAGRASTEIGRAIRIAQETVAPQFAEKGVRFRVVESGADKTRISASAEQLSRVLTNFFENALQNSDARSEVSVVLNEEPDSLLLQVLDTGPSWPHHIGEDFFSKAGPAPNRPEPRQVRLQFCRIAVENCQGEMGYERREDGANCCWIRLPKVCEKSENDRPD